jgi:L-lactate dehydrogenase complex protein LldF
MNAGVNTIKERAKEALKNEFLRDAVKITTDRLRSNKLASQEALGNWEWWRERGRQIRTHVIANLDYYLSQLAANVRKNGGHIYFCETGEEAVEQVLAIAKRVNAKSVVKSKSMVSEELHLNHALEAEGIEAVETDLGEYIIQLAKEGPSHIISPAIHKNRHQVAELFAQADGRSSIPSDTPTLTAFARAKLREKFMNGDIGVTGCNFAIAESGSICLFTNEGNGRMVTSLPRVHIAIMGMERIVPTVEDLEVMMNLLPRAGTGQKLTSYVSVVSGPRKSGEMDGPEEFHLIVVDNGRSEILADEEFRQVLNCIRCGACLNVCPVYRQIGGHAYGWVYPGPIGAVITPLLNERNGQYQDLPYASSLCAACYEACPVKIPLHDLLVKLRARNVEKGRTSRWERLSFRMYRDTFRSPKRYKVAVRLASRLQKPLVREGFIQAQLPVLSGWTGARDLKGLARESFRDRWQKLQKELEQERGETR